MSAFKQLLDPKSLEIFNEISTKPFAEQGIFFLNAYYSEVEDCVDYIYETAYQAFRYVDMEKKGISLIHLYDEGNEFDIMGGLRVYEYITKLHDQDPKLSEKYPRCVPEVMTAIARKNFLRDTVDCNCDGSISFVEYLLALFKFTPIDFVTRSSAVPENEAVRLAKLALEEVNKKIRDYETEKARLEAESELPGVKGLRAKNELAQLASSPLAETLRMLLIKAEAAVRLASRGMGATAADGTVTKREDGAIYWLNKDLSEKKKKYGK